MSIHIEIVLKSESANTKSDILAVAKKYLEKIQVQSNSVIKHFNRDEDPILHSEIQCIIINMMKSADNQVINVKSPLVNWYIYSLDTYGPLHQTSDEDDQLIYGTHFVLPSGDFYDLWENLYYDCDIKDNLLDYAHSMVQFSDNGIDQTVVDCNRTILLHGPPGTGKTTLCKALAHKLSVRMKTRYSSGVFIEIRSDSLFSKYFSESVKQVTKMFTKIREIVEDSSVLVCVLIDEVESLAHARNKCGEADPTDAIKVVNAVLTQIDQIKKYPNVIIFATSNMTKTIDLAFVDRADIKQFLGLPTVAARYQIINSCLKELLRCQIICSKEELEDVGQVIQQGEKLENKLSRRIMEVCEKSNGLSGRCLRKIPLVAHALFMKRTSGNVEQFLDAMEKAVLRELKERDYFANN